MLRDADARDRVNRLLDAVLAVGSGLELQLVLQRIAEVAVSLVNAQFGALGVVDEDGSGLSQFITVGVDDAGVAVIGAPPTGHGVLGELIRDPQPLRLAALSAHTASYGFPAGHPPMGTFLGVPVRVGHVVFGNLYLTEKRGEEGFTAEDESVVVALAQVAGVAIQNARLYDESRQRGAWMEAGRDISTSLLSGTRREDVIALVAERAQQVLAADTALVAIVGADGLQVEAFSGADPGRVLVRLADEVGQVLTAGRPVEVVSGGLSGTAVPLGPMGRACHGVVLALWAQRPAISGTHELTGFAAQAAVALELAERRDEAGRFALVEDRDRIGRDLHDLVIQRLFATGMQLQGAVRLVDQSPAEATTRINRAVDELDGTIRELRSTIYGLQAPTEGRPSLRLQLLKAVDAGTQQLGFAPTLRLDGLLDTLATPEVTEHALATLREALSNVARHARAHRVEVLVEVRGSTLQLRVDDDGIGTPEGAARSGLVNLASRAELLGGSLRISGLPTGGTRLLWSVPL